MAGGSRITINQYGVKIETAGKIEMYAAQHFIEGGKSVHITMPVLPLNPPKQAYSTQVDLGSIEHKDISLANAVYEVWTKDTKPKMIASGSLSDLARSHTIFTKEAQPLDFYVGENEWFETNDLSDDDSDSSKEC